MLLCGDRKVDKAKVARLVEAIPGLRAVNAGQLEMARIVEQLTPMLISINARYKTHAGIRIVGLARHGPLGVAVLAGGTGGAKLAAGLQDVVGDELAVIANTGDDVEVHGLLVCPDPDLCTYWLTGQIDEERGWGIRDDTFTVHERLAAARRARGGSRSPTATSPPACTAPTSSPRAARSPRPRARSPARWARTPRCCRCPRSRSAREC